MKTGFLTRNISAAFDRRWLPKALLASPFVFAAAFGGAQSAYSATATVSVWNIRGPIGGNPDASVADVAGLTGHVNTAANPLTIATVIENSSNPEGFAGLIFWNPVTNVFVDYGVGISGLAEGIDINLTAPPLTGPAGTVFGTPTFGPGDTWVGFSGSLSVNLKGSNNFRTWSVTGARGVKVDQSTGKVFFTDSGGGTINRLDPSTNTVTTWSVGGNPYYLTEDSSGNVFATVALATVAGGADAIVELVPQFDFFKAWAVPSGGLGGGGPKTLRLTASRSTARGISGPLSLPQTRLAG